MSQRFVYVARLQTGDEVGLRRVLEQLPRDAFAENGITEFSTYIGSGYCVLQFAISGEDFQAQFGQFANDPRVHDFHLRLAEHLVEGEQIARTFAAGDHRFHATATAMTTPEGSTVTSARLPLAAEVSRWPEQTK